MSVPSRTNSALVEGVLLADYDFAQNPDLTPFITAASAIIDQAVVCAARKRIALDPNTLLEMETWLAAHLYGCSDQPYSSRHTLRASGQFQGETKQGLEGTKYGQMAMRLDPSGCLTNIDKSGRMRVFWGGRACQGQWWNRGYPVQGGPCPPPGGC